MAKEQSTHAFIDIEEIREGVVVTRNKDLRAVLMVSSVNFDLKSSDEKEALILSFQRFLNSIKDFSIQLVVHSRPLDLTDYFLFLRERQGAQENELLKIQTSEYLAFVEELLDLSNIMSKYFYVVVPYNMTVAEKKGLFEKMFGRKKESEEEQLRVRFEEARDRLMLRVNQVASLLAEMDVRSILLSDKEVAELFYGLYNPGTKLNQENLELLIATGEKEKLSIDKDTVTSEDLLTAPTPGPGLGRTLVDFGKDEGQK
jgi:hypothetical protein